MHSLTFVYTKMFMTFDVNMKRVGLGSLNISHSQGWEAAVNKFQANITSDTRQINR